MRLVKPGERRPGIVGHDAVQQLREVGDRIDHLVARYGRLVRDSTDGRALSDFKDTIELLNGQIGYLARRLQELMVEEYDSRRSAAQDIARAQASLPERVAVNR